MNRVSRGFSKRSNGILQGPIGTIDGWLVKIIRPSVTVDGIENIVGFFSRKGFYALNCQVLHWGWKVTIKTSYGTPTMPYDIFFMSYRVII